MKRGKQAERMVQKKLAEEMPHRKLAVSMPHKKLAKKALALLLAAVTMLASMGTSIGMMEPVKVQAAGTGVTPTKEMFKLTHQGGDIVDGSFFYATDEELTAGIKLDVGLIGEYEGYGKGEITLLYGDSEDGIKTTGSYTISVKVAAADDATQKGEGNYLAAIDSLELATIGVYKQFGNAADQKIQYKTEDDTESSDTPKSAYNKAVTITAEGYKVSDAADGGFKTEGAAFPLPASEEIEGQLSGSASTTKIFYFQKEGETDIYAYDVTLTFDTEKPTIEDVTASSIQTNSATVTVTASSGETGATYSLVNKNTTEGEPYAAAETNSSGIFELTGLEPGTNYTFTATVTDAAGNVSEGKEVAFTTEKNPYNSQDGDVTIADDAHDDTANTVTFTGVAEKTANTDYEYTIDGKTWEKGNETFSDKEKLGINSDSGVAITISLDETKSYPANTIGVRVAETTTTKPSTGVYYKNSITVPLVLSTAANITGDAKFGKTLKASAASAQTSNLIYTFYRVEDKDGEETLTPLTLDAGTTDSYTIKEADIGYKIRLKVTAEGYGEPAENGTNDTGEIAKADGITAAAPTLACDPTDNEAQTAFTVTLTKQEGAKYRIVDDDGNGTWQSENVFTINASNIPDDKNVTFGVYIPGNSTREDGTEATAELNIPMITQDKPNLSYSVAKGENSDTGRIITISKVEGAVYSFDGGTTWSKKDAAGTPNVSTGLTTDNGKVTIMIKMPGSDTRSASEEASAEVDLGQEFASAPKTCTIAGITSDLETNPPKYTVTVTPPDGVTTYEYSFDDGQTWGTTPSKEYTASSDSRKETIYVRNHPSNNLPSEGVAYEATIPALIVKNPVITGTTPFKGSTAVTITCPTADASIYYTTDGTDPTSGSTKYTSPITISDETTVKAIATKSEMQNSGVTSKDFQKDETQSGGGSTPSTGGSSSSGSSGSSGSSSSSGSSGGSGTTSGSTGSGSSAPTTTTNPDGSTTTTKTETKSDGTKVTTETTTATDGSKKETVTEIKKDGTTTETTTETKTDGTKTESVVETNTDGSKTESTTETKADGSKTESVTEKAADGSVVKSTETVTASDGSATKTETENTQNAKGNDIEVTTTTKTDASGAVTSITEKTEIPESSSTTSTTVTVKKDNKGEVKSAQAEVENTVSSGSKATISSAVVSQITEAAGTDSVAITMTVKDGEGNTKYEVKVDSKDMEGGSRLYIYKLDTKTGKHIMVNAKTYTVSGSGSVSVSMKKNATYELVDAKEAAKINKEIKASIAPKKASQDLKPGKKTSFKLSSKANKESIKSITYLTSNKKVASVSENGKISAKKSGTVTVKAKVTLLNGSTKTVKMKVKVKK